MKKLTTFIKKNDILVMTLIIGIIVILEIFQGTLIAEDSLFDFGNMYKLYQGKLIYKDVNILITPIFFIIGKLLLSIFHGGYFTFLLYGVIIMTAFYIIIYKLFKMLELKTKFAMIYTMIIVMMSIEVIKGGTNYNALGLIFVFLGIIYSLKNAEKIRKNNNLVQAIIIITVFLTMQKLGVRICNKLYFI